MVRLEALSKDGCARFLEWAIADYAEAQVACGAWRAEQAPDRAREAVGSLLPQGTATPGHHLCAVVDDRTGARVGYVWFAERTSGDDRYVALYEFMIREEYRRQGYGSAALRVLEKEARAVGADQIVLHVFGHNAAARALYAKAGYVERNVTMVRRLARAGEGSA